MSNGTVDVIEPNANLIMEYRGNMDSKVFSEELTRFLTQEKGFVSSGNFPQFNPVKVITRSQVLITFSTKSSMAHVTRVIDRHFADQGVMFQMGNIPITLAPDVLVEGPYLLLDCSAMHEKSSQTSATKAAALVVVGQD